MRVSSVVMALAYVAGISAADFGAIHLAVQDPAPYKAAEQQLFHDRESETVCFNSACVPPGTYP